MKKEQIYNDEISLLKVKALLSTDPSLIARYKILSNNDVKSIILKTTEKDELTYSKFRLKKLSIDLAVIELIFMKKNSVLNVELKSEICEIPLEDDIFDILEKAYLNGEGAIESTVKPFVLTTDNFGELA